jgi:hypothetical protein
VSAGKAHDRNVGVGSRPRLPRRSLRRRTGRRDHWAPLDRRCRPERRRCRLRRTEVDLMNHFTT